MLAVKTFLKHFTHYSLGSGHFILRTDHKALAWLHSFKNPEGLIARCQGILAEYTYKQKHRQKIKCWDADAFTLIQQATPTISTVKLGEEKRRYWAEAQSKDLHISLIYDRPAHGTEKTIGEVSGRMQAG